MDENSEVLVRTFHSPIINETDFYLAQSLLHSERASQEKHLESMPLKGALKCSCGSRMTAAWYKGKNQHYLYYRCLKHMQVSYSGEKLHEEFRWLLKQLVLRKDQIDYLAKKIEGILGCVLSGYKKMIDLKTFELREADRKLAQAEEKFRDNEINQKFYSKWRENQLVKRGIIESELNAINKNQDAIYSSLYQQLPHLSNLETLYDKADYRRKQLLLTGVFKDGLIYSDNKFRTVNINQALHSCININKKPASKRISW